MAIFTHSNPQWDLLKCQSEQKDRDHHPPQTHMNFYSKVSNIAIGKYFTKIFILQHKHKGVAFLFASKSKPLLVHCERGFPPDKTMTG